MYNGVDGYYGGKWAKTSDDKDAFYPSETNSSMYPRDKFSDYMKRSDPDVVVVYDGERAGGGPVNGIGTAPMQANAYLVGEKGRELYIPDQGAPRLVGRDGPEIMVPPSDGVVIPNYLLQIALRLGLTMEQTLGLLREMRQLGGADDQPAGGETPPPPGPSRLAAAGQTPPLSPGGLRLEARAEGGAVEGTENPLLRQRVSEFVQSALGADKLNSGLDEGMLRAAAARAKPALARASDYWNGKDDSSGRSDEKQSSGGTPSTSSAASTWDRPSQSAGLDPGVMAAEVQQGVPSQPARQTGLQLGDSDPWSFQAQQAVRPFSAQNWR